MHSTAQVQCRTVQYITSVRSAVQHGAVRYGTAYRTVLTSKVLHYPATSRAQRKVQHTSQTTMRWSSEQQQYYNYCTAVQHRTAQHSTCSEHSTPQRGTDCSVECCTLSRTVDYQHCTTHLQLLWRSLIQCDVMCHAALHYTVLHCAYDSAYSDCTSL
jgi:hypothetical protein